MKVRSIILARVAAHLARTRETESSFGKRVANNHAWVERLRQGKVTLASIERALDLIDASRRKTKETAE